MKKLLTIFTAVISLLHLVGCGFDKQKKLGDTCPHMNCITGKIIEIKDNNTIMLQITEERGGYKVDDKVIIKYREIYNIYGNDPDANKIPITPSLQDEVGTQFWPKDITKKDGYDYIEVGSVEKYIN